MPEGARRAYGSKRTHSNASTTSNSSSVTNTPPRHPEVEAVTNTPPRHATEGEGEVERGPRSVRFHSPQEEEGQGRGRREEGRGKGRGEEGMQSQQAKPEGHNAQVPTRQNDTPNGTYIILLFTCPSARQTA